MPPGHHAGPTVLLTRPESASRRFAARLDGLSVLIAPLMRIVPVPHDATAIAEAKGLVFTSENAIASAGPGAGRPAICVGPRTAAVAREAGFAVTEGPGDAARLTPLLHGLGPGWLHPHGTHVAARLPVPGIVVYDQQELPLSDAARALLAGADPVVLPLFSPRSAGLAAKAAAGSAAPLWLASISPAADAAWDAAGRAEGDEPPPRRPVRRPVQRPVRRAVADTPDAAAVARCIVRLIATERADPGAG